MLKIFKRQKGRHEKPQRNNNDDNTAAGEIILRDSQDGNINDKSKRNSLRSTSSFCDEVFLEELVAEDYDGGGEEDIFNYHSRLSMTISTMVGDPNCLSYFVQYLETRSALSLIKFYLDIENFRTAAVSQLDKEQTLFTKTQHESISLNEQAEEEEDESEELFEKQNDKESERTNSVPELKTLCDLSMHKPITDDEKSQIYAESNKQLKTKCIDLNYRMKMSSQLSLISDTGSSLTRISATSIRDAIAIYQKYLIADAKQFVGLPVDILARISLHLCKCDEDDEQMTASNAAISVSIDCFDEAQKYVLEQLETNHLNDFVQSAFYCKYCIELIESNLEQLNIYDILYSEVTLFFFMEFLEQHSERDCLDFWTTAINFRKSFTSDCDTRNESEIQSDAMIIYEKFFSLQSDHRLWISEKLRSIVEERICAVGYIAYCFDIPLQVTAKYLDRKYLTDFLQSQLFEKYVNELKTKVNEEHNIGIVQLNETNGLINSTFGDKMSGQHKLSLKRVKGKSATTRHRKTLSDCTNNNTRELFKHISQHNTLLAGNDNNPHIKLNNDTNMNIDSRHLTNPNLLWHRSVNSGGGLKFGRINSLGRYERDFDVVDSIGGSAKPWSLAMNAMRKLVKLPEDKVQEEIAWQVAEMIVKDVTNVTMQSNSL